MTNVKIQKKSLARQRFVKEINNLNLIFYDCNTLFCLVNSFTTEEHENEQFLYCPCFLIFAFHSTHWNKNKNYVFRCINNSLFYYDQNGKFGICKRLWTIWILETTNVFQEFLVPIFFYNNCLIVLDKNDFYKPGFELWVLVRNSLESKSFLGALQDSATIPVDLKIN